MEKLFLSKEKSLVALAPGFNNKWVAYFVAFDYYLQSISSTFYARIFVQKCFAKLFSSYVLAL